MKNITIGITEGWEYHNYQHWMEREEGVDLIKLSHHQPDMQAMAKCDGILLTGGDDVHPRYYGKDEYLELCEDLDEVRDAFEWKVLEYTEKNRIPVLGICRGLQIANAFFGGTLLPHIPAVGKFNHSRIAAIDRSHAVQVDPNSLLMQIVGSEEGRVNSAHHQAADRVARGLVANALSPDGVVEGLEREGVKDGAFLLLVQWHPERMKDQESPFSKGIRKRFVDVVREGTHSR